MYSSFYNLDHKPFEMNPDPSFLWLGEKHKEVFSTMRYGITDNKGFLLLTGDAGSGKTTLIKALTQSLDKDIEWAVVADPSLERIDFYNAIAKGFGIEKTFTSKVQFLIQFSHFLHQADDENKKVLLLVDDCHRLSQEMLEELRLLSNIEKADAKLINIFFVGQPEFYDMLVQPKNRAMTQRLTLKFELHSLNINETDDYIRHRLKIAGTEEKLFAAKAVQVIHQFSRGIPRRINAICDHALVGGAVQAKQTIDNKLIESCVRKMDLPANSSQEDFETIAAEKSDFNHFSGKFISRLAPVAPSFSGFSLENDHRHGWLKYGLGLLVFFIAGVYFWFPASQSLESGQKVPAEIVKAPVAKGLSQVNSSSAVTMLEENKSEINANKAAELKAAILEEAYSNNGQKVSGQAVDSEHLVQEKPVVASMAPMEPRKVSLELRSNSLKLTNAGRKEFNNFVEKLKLYPRATVLVKGFVSGKSNSPENIKLSEDRAMSVQKLMLAKGIDVERIEVVGMGNKEPIASNNTSEGRKKNRRVEVIVINDGTGED